MLHPRQTFWCILASRGATGSKSFLPPAMKVGLYLVSSVRKLSFKGAGQTQPGVTSCLQHLSPDLVVCCVRMWVCTSANLPLVYRHVCSRLLSLWRAFSVRHILYCWAFLACIISISSQYFSPVPLSQESQWEPQLRGRGTKIAFPSAGSQALTSVMMFRVELTWSRTEMGEIMIVWYSGGGENGERYWVIHYSGAGSLSNPTPPKTGKPNRDDWCSSPHQIGCCIMGITRLYCWICSGRYVAVLALWIVCWDNHTHLISFGEKAVSVFPSVCWIFYNLKAMIFYCWIEHQLIRFWHYRKSSFLKLAIFFQVL